MTLPEVLTLEETAKLLKVPKEIVEREIKSGRLKAIKIGEEWRISDGALQQLFEQPSSDNTEIGTLTNFQTGDDFEYKWPSKYVEPFSNVKIAELLEGDGSVNVKIGECARDAFGRERKRLIVFFDDYPNAEFVETDTPIGYYYTFIPGNPKPRQHLWEGDVIDPVWRQFTIKKQSEVVTGPRTTDGLVIIVEKDELEAMVRFTRLKANRRWGW